MKKEFNLMDTGIKVGPEITARDAFRYMMGYTWLFLKAVWRNIDAAAHKQPWAFVMLVALACVVAGFFEVGAARAERDRYGRTTYLMEQKVDSLNLVIAAKDARR